LFYWGQKDGFLELLIQISGKLYGKYKTPAAAFATPAMYEVTASSTFANCMWWWKKLGTEKGNQIIAFGLEYKIKKLYIIRNMKN